MNTTLVNVKMYESTMDKLEKFQNVVHAPSRSDAIRRAIEISEVLANAVNHGDKIIIEGKNGKKREILISGLSNNDYR